MKIRSSWSVVVLLLGLALALPTWAVPSPRTVHIRQPLQVGDTQLAPGDYRLTVNGTEASFEKNNKVVAKVNCSVQEGEKSTRDAVIYDRTGAITEIRFSGQTQNLKFSPMTTASSPSKSTSTDR